MIIQGDQYPLKFKVTNGDMVITPNNISGIKMKFGGKTYTYPSSMSYDTASKMWVIQLTQTNSIAMNGCIDGEVQVNFGGTPPIIKSSPIKYFTVEDGLFKEAWQ